MNFFTKRFFVFTSLIFLVLFFVAGNFNRSLAATETDLSLRIQNATADSAKGQIVSYELRAFNNSQRESAFSVQSVTALPAGASYIAGSDEFCRQDGANIVCDFFTLQPQKAKFHTLKFQVDKCGVDLNLSVVLNVSNQNTDSNLSNNTANFRTAIAACPQLDLNLRTQNYPTAVALHDGLSYELRAFNNDLQNNIFNVQSETIIPDGFTYLPDLDNFCHQTNDKIICDFFTLEPQKAKFRQLHFSAQRCPINATIASRVFSKDEIVDPIPQNNISSVTTAISCIESQAVDLSIRTQNSPNTAKVGDVVSYELRVFNNHQTEKAFLVQSVTNVPNNYKFINDKDNSCKLSNGKIICDFFTIDPQKAKFRTLIFNVESCLSKIIIQSSVNSGQATDLNLSNNTSSFETAMECPLLSSSRPPYLTKLQDSQSGINVTRVTGDFGELIKKFNGESLIHKWGNAFRQEYVTASPWNIDGRYLMLRNRGDQGTRPIILFNGQTYEPLANMAIPTPDIRWSKDPNRPTLQYGIVGSGDIIFEYDVLKPFNRDTGEGIRQIKLPFNKLPSGKDAIVFLNGRHYAVYVGNPKIGNTSDTFLYLVDLDINTTNPDNQVIASYKLNEVNCGHVFKEYCSKPDANSLRFSPDGKYVVISYDSNSEFSIAARLFDIDIVNRKIFPHPIPDWRGQCPECFNHDPQKGFFPFRWLHPVFALGADRVVYFVGRSSQFRNLIISGIQTVPGTNRIGNIVAFAPATNKMKSLTNPNGESTYDYGTATNELAPGYFYASYGEPIDFRFGNRYAGKIIAMNLDKPGENIELTSHRTNANNCYNCEPHIVISPDGRKLLFPSTWGSNQSLVSSYVIDLPPSFSNSLILESSLMASQAPSPAPALVTTISPQTPVKSDDQIIEELQKIVLELLNKIATLLSLKLR